MQYYKEILHPDIFSLVSVGQFIILSVSYQIQIRFRTFSFILNHIIYCMHLHWLDITLLFFPGYMEIICPPAVGGNAHELFRSSDTATLSHLCATCKAFLTHGEHETALWLKLTHTKKVLVSHRTQTLVSWVTPQPQMPPLLGSSCFVHYVVLCSCSHTDLDDMQRGRDKMVVFDALGMRLDSPKTPE